MPSGQRHHRRLQPHPERAGADHVRQPGAGPRQTVPTAQPVRAMLGPGHAHRRQLTDLVATEPTDRPLLCTESTSAAAARLRIMIDDPIHLILGLQFATRTQVPGLPTSLTPFALPAHQLLGLGTSLRSPLRARLRRIHRWWCGTRARIPTRLLLQPPQPILVLLNPARQLENELNTRHPPRVVDRLRLGTIHACKIRCTNKESLPHAPTTERLRLSF